MMSSINISLFKPGSKADQCKIVHQTAQVKDFTTLAMLIADETPWSPGIYVDNTRLNANIQSMDLLVLDVDDGMPLDEALNLFNQYAHLIATTKSHQKEKNGVVADRYRVILKLEKPITTDREYKEVWYRAFARWPFIDKQCKDVARFFFACTDVVSINEAGASFTMEPGSAVAGPPAATKDVKKLSKKTSGDKKGKLSASTKDFIVNGAVAGEWHGRFYKACVDLKEQLYDQDEATVQLAKATGHLDDTDLAQIDDVYNNRESKYAPRVADAVVITDWPDVVVTVDAEGNEKTKIKASDNNVEHALKKYDYVLSYNKVDETIYVNGKRAMNDEDLAWLWTRCEKHGLVLKKDKFLALLSVLANRDRYNPLKDGIERVPWDGTDRFEALWKTITVPFEEMDRAPILQEYLKKWVVGCVAKLYAPGIQNLVLTLNGPQGVGKSRWFAKFAIWDKAFGEGQIDPRNKDHDLRHLTHMIWHISELESTTAKRDVGSLKDYLTKDYISVRPAYARFVRSGRSMCSFCASVNDETFLMDYTGNRRFLVIPINNIDHKHTIDMQQLFAQAKVLWETGYRYWFDGDEIIDINEQNEAYENMDKITDLAAKIKPGDEELSAVEILSAAGFDHPNNGDIKRFGSMLRRKKIHKLRKTVNGVKIRLYKVTKPKGDFINVIPSINKKNGEGL